MEKNINCFVLSITVSLCLACQRKSELRLSELSVSPILTFDTPVVKPLLPLVSEISGIVDSKRNPGFLWAEEDGGNPPNLLLISHDGNVEKTIPVKGAINYDWEDMTLAGDQLYIADIGDNKLERKEYTIYQFTEPSLSVNLIENFKTINFKYPNGTHDADALLVDPVKKDIYIITKGYSPSEIYKLSYPQSFTEFNTATKVGALSYAAVVSAALSADATNIIIKTYGGLNLYKRKGSEDINTTLLGSYSNLDYQLEPQGEAVTFAADNTGFYTLSEKGLSNAVNLYFYRKK